MNPASHPWLLTAVLAYLLGSIPFGYLLVRTFLHQDIRTTGSGNIGATNVARAGAKKLGLLTLLLDCLKGVAAVLLAFLIARHTPTPATFPNAPSFALALASSAACFAILGHIFPIWLGLRGGKGVATALGVFLVLSPRCVAVALAVFLATFLLTRFVSLASMLAAAAIPLAAAVFLPIRGPWTSAAVLGIPLLVIAKHNTNIRRLLAGTESRFGKPSQKATS